MANLDFDIADGTYVRQTVAGYEVRRKCWITGLPESNDPEYIRVQALQTSGVPRIGDLHPRLPIKVLNREAEAKGPTQALVTIDYGLPSGGTIIEGDDPLIEVGARTVTIRTAKDVYGNPIEVEYSPEDGVYLDKRMFVEMQVPSLYIKYTRREGSSPGDMAKNYVGRINKTPVFGDPRHYWMISSIDGTSDDGGESYVVSYEFTRAVDGSWDVWCVWTDDNGFIGSEVTFDLATGTGNGAQRFQVMPEVEFSTLGLNL